jgi:hypothetical protein
LKLALKTTGAHFIARIIAVCNCRVINIRLNKIDQVVL